MRGRLRSPLLLVMVLALVGCSGAQEAKSDSGDVDVAKALDNAMDPGEGHKKLDFMVREFDVKIRTWLDPEQDPIESNAVAINT